MKWAVRSLLAVVAAGLLFAGWSWLALNYVYSRGERAGYIQKISERGWVFKTWEGQLAMANLPGAMPEIFTFTVRDHAVAREIEKRAGQRVSLTYEYHPGLPGRIFGDTLYFVTRVTPIAEAYQMQSSSPAVPPAMK